MCQNLEIFRIRAKQWNLLVWMLQTGTVFYYVFWCGCIGRLRLLEQLSGDACTNSYIYSCDGFMLTELYESGIGPLSFISTGVRIFWTGTDIGARWIYRFLQSTLPSWYIDNNVAVCIAVYGAVCCINIVGENTINELNLQLEVSYLFQLWHGNMCNLVISWFCDIVVDRPWWSTNLWFRDFVTTSYGTVMIGTFACLENCEFGMSWLIQPSNLRSCEFGWCSWGTMTWNPGFTLFETKLAGIDTFRCLEYRLQVLNKVGCFFQHVIRRELLGSVFGKQNLWSILFWPNEFELTILVEPK